MAYKNVYEKLGLRMSEEFQLLAEEKWILEALSQLKNQRNCLQIERLHLESLKSRIKKSSNGIPRSPKLQIPEETVEDNKSFTSSVTEPKVTEPLHPLLQQNAAVKGVDQNDVAKITLDDETIYEEELFLNVDNTVFGMNRSQSMEEDDEEESTDDDMFIDMNMLLNGAPCP